MNEAWLQEIRALYSDAEKRIADQLSFGNLSAASAKRKTVILARIQAELKSLGTTTSKGFASVLPSEYSAGANGAQSLAGFGKRLTTANFAGIDTAAVETALASALGDTDFALSQVFRRCKELVQSKSLDFAKNAGISRIVAASEASGASVAELSRELAGYINPAWFDKYVAAQKGEFFKLSGRTWRVSDYAHLTAQTHMGTTQNMGSMNWSLKHGFRFSQMSKHPGACKTCALYQGKVYSLTGRAEKDHTGKMRQPISVVPGAGGLVHPYCGHNFSPWGIPDEVQALEFGDAKTAAAAVRHPDPVEPTAGKAGGFAPSQAAKVSKAGK